MEQLKTDTLINNNTRLFNIITWNFVHLSRNRRIPLCLCGIWKSMFPSPKYSYIPIQVGDTKPSMHIPKFTNSSETNNSTFFKYLIAFCQILEDCGTSAIARAAGFCKCIVLPRENFYFCLHCVSCTERWTKPFAWI